MGNDGKRPICAPEAALLWKRMHEHDSDWLSLELARINAKLDTLLARLEQPVPFTSARSQEQPRQDAGKEPIYG